MRASPISAAAAKMTRAASCRLSDSSVTVPRALSASRKKQAPPAHRALSTAMSSTESSSCAPEARQPSRPVRAITRADISGAVSAERAARESCRMKSSVNTATQAAA